MKQQKGFSLYYRRQRLDGNTIIAEKKSGGEARLPLIIVIKDSSDLSTAFWSRGCGRVYSALDNPISEMLFLCVMTFSLV